MGKKKDGEQRTTACRWSLITTKTQGTTDRHSVNALESYLRRLTPPAFKVMFEHSRTTTAQMIADVLGVDKSCWTFTTYSCMNRETQKTHANCGSGSKSWSSKNRNLANDLQQQRKQCWSRKKNTAKKL